MNKILSLTTATAALAVFATTLIMPIEANAANRRISAKARLNALSAQTIAEAQGNDVASAAVDGPQERANPKAFRIDNIRPLFRVDEGAQKLGNNEVVTPPPVLSTKKFTVPSEPDQGANKADPDTQGNDGATASRDEPRKVFDVPDDSQPAFDVPDDTEKQTNNNRATPPKSSKSQQFTVPGEQEQFSVEPNSDAQGELAPEQTERPLQLLSEKPKATKKFRPAPIEPNDEQALDDTDQSAAINDDQPDTSAPVDEAFAETPEEPAFEPVVREKHRMYYYASKQKSYDKVQQDDYAETEPVTYSYRHHYVQSYQPRYYAGSSCHHSYNGY
jgi:hypothetical protein